MLKIILKVIMLISTALLLDSIIRNSVCTPAKLPCRRVEIAVPPGGGGIRATKQQLTISISTITLKKVFQFTFYVLLTVFCTTWANQHIYLPSNKTAPQCPRILNSSFKLAYSKRAQIFESLIYLHPQKLLDGIRHLIRFNLASGV
jgi:hypothetical protein